MPRKKTKENLKTPHPPIEKFNKVGDSNTPMIDLYFETLLKNAEDINLFQSAETINDIPGGEGMMFQFIQSLYSPKTNWKNNPEIKHDYQRQVASRVFELASNELQRPEIKPGTVQYKKLRQIIWDTQKLMYIDNSDEAIARRMGTPPPGRGKRKDEPLVKPFENDTHTLDRMAEEGLFDEMLKRRRETSNKQEKTAKSKPQSSNLLLQERTEETLSLSPFISPAIPKEDEKPQDEEVKTDDLSTLIKTKFAKDIDESKPIDESFAKRLTALQVDASIEKSPHHQTLFNANTKLFEQLYPSPRRKRLNRFKGKSQTIGEFMKAQGLT